MKGVIGISPSGLDLGAPDGRPIPLVDNGEPVRGIFG
jgi:hypothetical protein